MSRWIALTYSFQRQRQPGHFKLQPGEGAPPSDCPWNREATGADAQREKGTTVAL